MLVDDQRMQLTSARRRDQQTPLPQELIREPQMRQLPCGGSLKLANMLFAPTCAALHAESRAQLETDRNVCFIHILNGLAENLNRTK